MNRCTPIHKVLAVTSISAYAWLAHAPTGLAAPGTVPTNPPPVRIEKILTPAQPAAVPAPAVQTAAKREALFKRVMTELDMNGDMLAYINADNLCRNLIQKIRDLAAAIPAPPDAAVTPQEYVSRLDAFLQKNGFYSIEALGMSIIPRADGLNTVKAFIARDPAAAETPFWRMFGGKPGALTTLNYLPGDTVWVQAGNLDLREAWTCLRAGMTDIAGPQVLEKMDEGLRNMQTQTGFDLKAFFQAVGNEAFFSLQLAETATATIPLAPGEQLTIPQPAAVCGITLRDAAAARNIVETFIATVKDPQGNPQFVKTTNAGGVTLYNSSTPIPAPIPLQPTFAIHQNMLLIGSSINAVNNALAAATAKNGLCSQAAFRQRFSGKLDACNGISSVDERFVQTLNGIFRDIAKGKINRDQASMMAGQMTEKLLGLSGNNQSAMVRVNKPDGMAISGFSGQSGQQIVMMIAVLPVSIMAGMALPAFSNARGQARHMNCLNNLRQLDAAKEQWALENNKGNGAVPTLEDLQKFLGQKPVCPVGGQYNINPIGTAPQCTFPGHSLGQP